MSSALYSPSNVFDAFANVVDRPVSLSKDRDEFWRREEPIIQEQPDGTRQVLRGGMFSGQRQWWELPNFIKMMVGGYGAGKTSLGGKRAISLAFQNAPAPVAFVSPTYPLARRTVIPTIEALLAGKRAIFGNQFWYRFNKSTHEFKLRFRGRNGLIYIHSGEDPLSLRGPNLAAALVDEPFIQDRAVFEQMIARVRHPDAVHKEIGLLGTPEQLNWGYDLALGEDRDKHDVGVVTVSSRANLALDTKYVQRLEGALSEKAVQAYVDGRFIQLSTGLVYYGFKGIGSENVIDLPIPPGAEIGCGMDFNVNPFAFVVFWRAGSHMHYMFDYELENADTEYACSVLKEHFVEDGSKRRIP
jgi:hypothetical protein